VGIRRMIIRVEKRRLISLIGPHQASVFSYVARAPPGSVKDKLKAASRMNALINFTTAI
jgi:hypothetical protein